MLIKDPDAVPDKWGKRPSDRSVGELLQGGVLILDKPSGPTSHQATAWVRDALRCDRVGHGGTLDPYVSGVLPITLGKATRLTDVVLSSDKEYVCLIPIEGIDYGEDEDENALIFLEIIPGKDGQEDVYQGVEDEKLLNELYAKYLEAVEFEDDEE